MVIEAEFHCAFCGEPNTTVVDISAGLHQNYTEDCQVCCRPNVLHIEVDAEDVEEVYIEAEPEG